MNGGPVIASVNLGNERFQRHWRKKLTPEIRTVAAKSIASLVNLDIRQAPAKLHLHPLTDVEVSAVKPPPPRVKVYTIHITPDDRYKASFTFEHGVAYFRACGEHDQVDKNP